MTDKEKIKAEVIRYKNEIIRDNEGTDFEQGFIAALESIETFIDNMPEETSEDLEKVADNYASGYEQVGYDEDHILSVSDAFIDGAKWQKGQMMKDAVNGVVTLDYWDAKDREVDVILGDNVIGEEHGIKDGDKVKLLIIKED